MSTETGGYVIVCRGLVSNPLRGPIGQYLKVYDPEAFDGRGDSEWTTDIDDAMHFKDGLEAWREWTRVPSNRPVRESDGAPNKPLTAFTVEITPHQSQR